jgi:hypothetical protein
MMVFTKISEENEGNAAIGVGVGIGIGIDPGPRVVARHLPS